MTMGFLNFVVELVDVEVCCFGLAKPLAACCYKRICALVTSVAEEMSIADLGGLPQRSFLFFVNRYEAIRRR